MKILLLAISVFFLGLSAPAGAETARHGDRHAVTSTDSLKVSAVRAGSPEVEPPRIVTSIFLITNNSSRDIEVSSRVDLPDGWLVITGDSTIYLGANQRDISLVSILVPRTSQPRQYQITYTVSAVGRPDLADCCSVPIVILPVAKLEVKSLGVPDFVVAGDEFKASFAISNRGNAAVEVRLRTETASDMPFVLENQMLEILPGQTRGADLSLKTDPQLKKTIRDNLTLIAEAADPKVEAHATCPVEVIPRVTGVEDRFERVPSLLSLRSVTGSNGETRSRFQGEISGDGTFGRTSRNRLTFLFKGPDVQRIGVLGRRDEYFLTYSAGNYEVAMGDRTYSVSQLTESHRYGRGLEAKIKLKRFRLGAYSLRNSSDEPREEQTAAYLDCALNSAANVGINYLFKDKGRASHIVGLDSRIAPARNTDIKAEYSAGLTDSHDRNAYYLELRSMQKRASGSLMFIHADPDYPGCFRDMEFISSTMGLVLRATTKLNVSFRQERHNLGQDEPLSIPREREYQLRLDERIKATDISLGWRTRSHENRQNGDGFDNVENVVRSSVGQRFDRWNYHAALESGWIHDEQEGRSSSLQRCSASLHLHPTNRQTYSCYLSYDTSRIPGKPRKRYVAVGLSSSFKLRANTAIDVGFRSNDYEYGESLQSNMLDVTLCHRLPNKSAIILRGHYRPWESQSAHDEIAVSLEYAIPIGMPVAKRRTVGAVKGRVYDDLSGLPVRDAILRLDGATAVTDAKGNFIFPSIAKGSYHLRLDRASIGFDRMTIQKVPIEVAVEGGKETALQIGVTRRARLQGRVMLYRSTAEGTMPSHVDNADLIEDRGLPDLLVELTDGVETKRVFTDEKGRFTFEEMRPGAWTLRVSEDNLPEYTRLEMNTFEFSPMPGEEMQALVRVLPQKRQVQILQEGGVLKEQKSPK